MPSVSLLYRREYAVSEQIPILIPTVGDILDHEDDYYGLVSMLTAMPIDMIAQLDEAGVDFTQINDYDLFLMFFKRMQESDTSMIFGDRVNLGEFYITGEQGNIYVRNPKTGAVIDRAVQIRIANTLRKIHHLEKNTRTPGNEEARLYMIERAKVKYKRRKNRTADSQLEELIVAMVNTSEFPYDFGGVRDLTIYQFNESVRQVIKKIDYDNKMHGIYSGTVSAKDLKKEDLNWLTHK